ncbi:hypothetical protein [Mesorhizobium sp.]|uniref:hypothetical protein n=1 Tax=Mesorhizobium sp. TaxID=1871066 RepID=UPI003BAA66FD
MQHKTNLEFDYAFRGQSYRCVVERLDRAWGHGLKVWRYDSAGNLLDRTRWGCHPEFENFEALQKLTTEDLIELVRRDMRKEAFEVTMQSANAAGLTIFFTILLNEDDTMVEVSRGL